MKDLHLAIPYREASLDELDNDRRRLCLDAIAATDRAYAPYSNFHVGAALQLADGTVVLGSNQENAAYPSGLCAERTAAFFAHSQYPDQPFRRIAIAAKAPDGNLLAAPVTPCGACRQVLIEYEHLAAQPVELLLIGRSSVIILPSIASSLPFAFTEI